MARAAIAAARASDGGVVLVEGPGGIGKSRLLEAAAAAGAAMGGVAVHRAGGDELEVGFAFGVLRQLLESVLHALPIDVRRAMADGPAALALAALEGWAPATGERGGQAAVAYSVHWLVQQLAEDQPRVLCIDDAQWADLPTLATIEACSRRLEGSPVLFVIAARSAAEPPAADLLARIGSSPRARRLLLQPLGQRALGALAAARLGRAVDAELCHGLWRATGGNPFLAHQLLTVLDAEGFPDADAGALARLAPQGVTDAILRRLAAEGGVAERLTEAVAILGECDVTAAAALAAVAEADAVAATDRLAALDILTPGRQLAFAHPVVGEAVRRQIPPTRKLWLHARAAALLRERGAAVEQVAGHLTEGLPRGQAWAVETLLAAAAEAFRHGSPETAVGLLTRAWHEPPPANLRGRVELELGTAQAITGHPHAIATLERAVTSAQEPTGRAAAGLRLARTLGLTGETRRAFRVLDEVEVEACRVEPDALLQLETELLGLARLNADTRADALQALERRRDRADPPRPASAALWSNLALSALERNDPPGVVADLAECAMRGGWLLEDETFQLAYAGGALIWIDRFEQAAATWDDAVHTARQRGSLTLAAMAHALRSHLNLRRGQVAEAVTDGHVAYEIATSHDWGDAVSYAQAYLAEALLEQGAVDQAATLLEQPAAPQQAEDNAFVWHVQGRLHLARAQAEEAVRAFLACGEALAVRGGVDTPGLLAWRSGAAVALTRSGEHQRARELAVEELEHARATLVPGAIGQTLTTLGLLEHGEQAIARLREAVAVLEGSPRVLARALALLELGTTLRRQRQPRAARPPLRSALDLADRCGATALADRAHQELKAAGARPRRTALTGVDALTASERRVAELAVQGLTNRQIAQQLYVSMRTVAVHLTHVYQKLGIKGREDLPHRLEPADRKPVDVAPPG